MNKIIFEDLCQNFIEEVNFLILTEKNKFVDIVVSFDKANFGDEKKKKKFYYYYWEKDQWSFQ